MIRTNKIMFTIGFLLFCQGIMAEEIALCKTIEECASSLKQQVEMSTVYTDEMLGHNYQGIVNFKLDPNFSLLSVEVTKSSGNMAFDQAMINALKRAKSFPQLNGLPNEIAKSFREVRLKFMAPE